MTPQQRPARPAWKRLLVGLTRPANVLCLVAVSGVLGFQLSYFLDGRRAKAESKAYWADRQVALRQETAKAHELLGDFRGLDWADSQALLLAKFPGSHEAPQFPGSPVTRRVHQTCWVDPGHEWFLGLLFVDGKWRHAVAEPLHTPPLPAPPWLPMSQLAVMSVATMVIVVLAGAALVLGAFVDGRRRQLTAAGLRLSLVGMACGAYFLWGDQIETAASTGGFAALVLAAAIAASILVARAGKLLRRCGACAFDLTGHASDTCPGCGQPVAPPTAAPLAAAPPAAPIATA